MRYDGDHKSETRRRVLKEAAREIRAKGPGGVGVAGIMARAGLTHGGFYAHFDSKEALVAAAIETMFESAGRRFDATAAGDDPRAALRAYVDFYLSPGHRDAREHGCPLPALSGDLARLDPEARTRFGQGVAGLTARLADALGRHGMADSEAAGGSMLAEMVGAVTLSRAVADPAQSDAILDRARASVIARFSLGDMQ
ncbi:TetR/AcrR family transcriptional regulator [Sphingomonas sp. QA11]|uniref:TetR/AcrR family transcriptional regulator n=1 Tax=Sphingomonas sp. QA11 TaxID=2950605 RepID=UPI00234B0219|nr:TetR/AcrR family transcriptional regulator [Sphingomonas sp. QA11]WCM27721.1 TetR/AcrR family transcriptional regulator [Sphingomonas sp. QA11]